MQYEQAEATICTKNSKITTFRKNTQFGSIHAAMTFSYFDKWSNIENKCNFWNDFVNLIKSWSKHYLGIDDRSNSVEEKHFKKYYSKILDFNKIMELWLHTKIICNNLYNISIESVLFDL